MMAYILLVSHFTIVFVGYPSTFDLRGWWLTFFVKKGIIFCCADRLHFFVFTLRQKTKFNHLKTSEL